MAAAGCSVSESNQGVADDGEALFNIEHRPIVRLRRKFFEPTKTLLLNLNLNIIHWTLTGQNGTRANQHIIRRQKQPTACTTSSFSPSSKRSPV